MIQGIKTAVQGPYFVLFVLWFLLFSTFTIYINQLYVVGNLVFNLPVHIQYPFLAMFVINNALAAISINLAIMRIRILQKAASASRGLGVSFFGTFVGILGGACPGCIAGLFPAFVGLFGSRFALSQLPLYGLELQLLGSVLMILGIYLLTRPIVCLPK
tara:strand:- start:111 stop:587 length:477 start_codon:yes stop_codon:yes gene_type:complete